MYLGVGGIWEIEIEEIKGLGQLCRSDEILHSYSF